VNVYNASNNMLLASGITNSSGMVTLHVVAIPNVSETLKIIATPQGYPPQGVLYTIKGPGTYAITLKVYPTSLSLNVLGAYIGTVQVAPAQPSSVTASEGEPLSLIVQATYEGSPASNATVSATMQIGGTNVTGTVVPVGNGVFNVTFMVPSVGVPLSGYIVVTASYKGSTAQLNVPVVAQVNYGTYLNSISSSVAQVNETVAALQEELSAFNSTVTSVQKQLQSLSTQLSSLNSSIASLSSQLNQLSSQVSSLSSQLSSSQNMVYAGLIVGIIALIIAIVALVMVLRKIS
jgi:flagellin-like hook-associated protein FlgL